MQVGMIGLGHMGSGMAGQLLEAGHDVHAWNRSPGPAEEMAKKGAVRAGSLEEAFQGEAALTMLANDAAVRAVILDSGVLEKAPKGFVHVVCATISVALAKELEEAHRNAGVAYVAAPVLGRPDLAASGQLNIVAAGAAEAIAKVQPLLDAIGKQTWPVGDEPHKANVAKLCVNFLLAAAIESMGEAMSMAEGHALDPARLLEILTGTLFAAPAYKIYGELIVERKFTPPAFKLDHGLKDVKLALAASEEVHSPMPIAGILRDGLLDALAHGGPDQDWSALGGVTFRRSGRT